MDCGKVGRFVFIRLMAKVLQGLLQINFNFTEGFDGIDPAQILVRKSFWIEI